MSNEGGFKILRELRERSGLTLREVETATGISNAYLSQLENGKIKSPGVQMFYVLAKLYSSDAEKLLIQCGVIKPVTIKPVEMKPSVDARLTDIEKRLKQLENWYSLHQNMSV
jgi:transcriptional regulator with XRE-family HTH domain